MRAWISETYPDEEGPLAVEGKSVILRGTKEDVQRFRAGLSSLWYGFVMSRTTVEQITALAESASEQDRQTILRFAMFSVGLDVDDAPQPSKVSPEQLAQSIDALGDIDAGNGVPYEAVRDRINSKLKRHGV